MTRQLTALGFVLVIGLAVAVAGRAQSSTDKWWPGYGNGADNARYFASQQITKANVTGLQVAWTYPHSDGGYPIVVRGVVYGRGRNGSLVAVDAKTGKELWVRENMNGMSSRGVTYWASRDGRDERLIFPMNSLLQEVDAKTGKSIMSFGTSAVPVGAGDIDWKRIFTLVKAANLRNIVAEVGAYGASTLQGQPLAPPDYSVLELYKRSADFLHAFSAV